MITYMKNFLNYKELLKELVSRDIKTKYRRSILGILWTVLNPLGMMIIMTIVFSNIFRQNIENYPVYLMCGQVVFNFFSEASNMAMNSILGNASLIKKVYIPKYIFPASRVCSSFVNLLTSFIALTIVIIATRTPISWTILLVFIPILYVFLFALGIGVLLAALVVSFRDMLHLYGVIITGWMYLTPIFYPLEIIPEKFRVFIAFNPLASIIEMFRDVVMYGVVPDVLLHVRCVVPCIIALIVGLVVFYKQQDSFILKL